MISVVDGFLTSQVDGKGADLDLAMVRGFGRYMTCQLSIESEPGYPAYPFSSRGKVQRMPRAIRAVRENPQAKKSPANARLFSEMVEGQGFEPWERY